jgi:hypothetical protein
VTDTKRWTRRVGIGALCSLFFWVSGAAAQPRVNPQAAAMAEFSKRVQDYVALQKRVAGGLPPLKATANDREIAAAELALGDAIRAARATAQPGDIFTPDVAPMFQQVIREHYEQKSAHGRKEMLDEVPLFRPVVNQVYPKKLAMATFPPTLFQSLPKLPPEVQYRIVGTSLVLVDLKAHVIVDFIPNVLPAAAKKHEGKS